MTQKNLTEPYSTKDLQSHNVDKAYKGSQTQDTNHAHYENELILRQLHTTQEHLENSLYQYAQDRAEQSRLALRLENLTRQYPALWEFSEIEVKLLTEKNALISIRWVVRNTYIDNIFHAEICLRTVYQGDITSIILEKIEPNPYREDNNDEITEVRCAPRRGPFSIAENVEVTAIGTTNWRLLNSLIPKIIHYLENQQNTALEHAAVNYSRQGLVVLQKMLKSWPNVLRYDSIKLSKVRLSDEYQALEISLINVNISDRVLPKFTFTLSTCNQPFENFGEHPRLEFHEESKDCFDNWFVETADSRGSRLELRFARPDIMDVAVWHKLAPRDQLLIGATISKLPELLSHFENEQTNTLDWNKWRQMSAMIRSALQNSLKN